MLPIKAKGVDEYIYIYMAIWRGDSSVHAWFSFLYMQPSFSMSGYHKSSDDSGAHPIHLCIYFQREME